jgi:hypothetical protein
MKNRRTRLVFNQTHKTVTRLVFVRFERRCSRERVRKLRQLPADWQKAVERGEELLRAAAECQSRSLSLLWGGLEREEKEGG